MLVGHVRDDEVLLARQGDDIFAVSAHCTHYHGPLAEGLLVDGTVRCPWHHACFSLRTGEPLLIRIRPYRTAEERIDGVVVTFVKPVAAA